MNELSVLAKFIFASLTEDSAWVSDYIPKGSMFFPEIIPQGINVSLPHAMFTVKDSTDIRGAFGYRLFTKGIYEIKAVVEGADFSLIEDLANQLDRIFDWQNQIDEDAGRPRSQEQFTDPDNSDSSIVIMCLVREKPVKYTTFSDGVNYCHLGGEYYVEYYAM